MQKTTFTSLFLAAIMLVFLSTFLLARNIPNPPKFYAAAMWTMFLTGITFMIFRTGRISKYRAAFFIIYAVSFILVFVSNLIEERGSMALTAEVIAAKETPLCPVALPGLILPAVIKKSLIFPTKLIGGASYGGFLNILILWLVSVVTLGRGWCSWGCFYGGIDEGFSKILRKPALSSKSMNEKFRLLPFAVLFVVIVWAFIVMEPVYCSWLCPLKLVTEYPEINNLKTYLQAVIFITLGMGLLVILPVLTKKRIQCGLFCPLGALQSILGKVNPYRVVINKDKCTACGLCKKVCPDFSITDETIAQGSVSLTCTRCGKCMDVCPHNALDYSLAGACPQKNQKKLSARILEKNHSFYGRIQAMPVKFLEEIFEPRTLFLFGAILFGSIISGRFVTEAILRTYNLFTTGTFLFK